MAPPVPPKLDHLVYAAPDLERAVEALDALLGVRATPGGRHEGVGTRNALIALSAESYLEIIAPDPSQPAPAGPRPFGLDGLATPRLAAWAVKAPNIDAVVERARAAGYDPGTVRAMSRVRPDGRRLDWRLTLTSEPACDGLVPFLIDWGTAESPAAGAAHGCQILALRAEYPNPQVLQRHLAALGVDMQIVFASRPRLVAAIASPRGVVELA